MHCGYFDTTQKSTLLLCYWHHRRWLVGDVPFHLKSPLKVTHNLRKMLTSTDFSL